MSLIFNAPFVLIAIAGLMLWTWLKRAQLRALPRADRLSALLRLGALVMLSLALAGPCFTQSASDRYIYFLVDRSASTQVGSAEILRIVRTLAKPAPQTHYSLMSFAAEPIIESNFAPVLQITELQTEPRADATDLESAVRLALETFPAKGVREIVLLFDGQATTGDLSGALARARRAGVPIHVWPLAPSEQLPEVWLHDLQLPQEVAPGLPFPLRLRVGATQSDTGTLLLYRNDELIQTLSVDFAPGVQELRLTERIESPGAYYYRIYLKAGADGLSENNQLEGATLVPGGAQILVIERRVGESTVARLLASANFSFEQKAFEDFATTPIAGYKAVIFNNVPLEKLSPERRDALKRFVADLGGGLLLIQGRQAVAGLDDRTPEELADLEALLPVSYLAPEPYQIPGLALVFLLDRSGSMGDPAGGGVPKIEILKRAALRSLEVLDEEDWVGLIAFDTEPRWVVPLQPLGDKRVFYQNIQTLSANGGTDAYFALTEAFKALENVPARIKHILIFTDGYNNSPREREYREFYKRLEKSSVRISALGIGAPHEIFLRGLAAAGRGKYQRVQELTDLPVFSLREVRRIARLRWIEGELPVQSMLPLALPPLQGYVLTYEKPAAQLALTSGGDPVLAFWTYGLGRVGVLNTDLEGDGSRDWLAWDLLGKLIGESVAQIYRRTPGEQNLTVQTTMSGESLELFADVREGSRWASGLNVSATLSGAKTQEIHFTQIAPGRYRARVERPASGLYALRVRAERDGQTVAETNTPVAVPYSEEYRKLGLDTETLDKIARATGGQFLERPFLPSPSTARIGQEAYRELWPLALFIALGLFLIDLAARKLLWLLER